ncbi:tRNA (adenosine(37)-N6)-dimethylallyltransferase MiaA [Thiohalocapsa halophila]|uniref:tRNA dimethylallyltransferase n=1 Tax=Thiohalocapsa halophila TaxID=69359 RepID=A0ABS1CFR1_9GAMM|nr:tRNA (adenosine(37)-N6)-dimethylallyltransferase MiaA [Thiohalocapsa halophila]MBK1630339.1 tRNA (adenosine(37)-N6)-dimethylallyltransferase MiaA [Thiohalocapsa halophila]
MGPTASGKTDLAVAVVDALAPMLPCEIVSVDSALVYRGLDIGTAKPSPALRARYPHRLVDICDPAEAYSAARFRADALAAIAQIRARGALPLLVGGTMLYFRALLRGLSPLPEADPALRERLAREAAARGPVGMHGWLADVDPAAAARIHPNDPQRVQRALEVYLASGRPMSSLWQAGDGALDLPTVKLVRSPRERAVLHRRIETRFDAMLAAGFLDEVRGLMRRGDLAPELPAMRAVGYRQAWAHLAGAFDAATMRARALAATRQLAKRQYTWLRSEPDCTWLWDEAAPLAQALAILRRRVGLGA